MGSHYLFIVLYVWLEKHLSRGDYRRSGAGFVGSSLAIAFKAAHPKWEITSFDNLRRRGSELNLPRLRKHGIRFAYGDIRSATDLDEGVLDKPGIVIDCSAEPAVLTGVSSPQYVLQTTLLGTVNVLELCRLPGTMNHERGWFCSTTNAGFEMITEG